LLARFSEVAREPPVPPPGRFFFLLSPSWSFLEGSVSSRRGQGLPQSVSLPIIPRRPFPKLVVLAPCLRFFFRPCSLFVLRSLGDISDDMPFVHYAPCTGSFSCKIWRSLLARLPGTTARFHCSLGCSTAGFVAADCPSSPPFRTLFPVIISLLSLLLFFFLLFIGSSFSLGFSVVRHVAVSCRFEIAWTYAVPCLSFSAVSIHTDYSLPAPSRPPFYFPILDDRPSFVLCFPDDVFRGSPMEALSFVLVPPSFTYAPPVLDAPSQNLS